MTVRTQPTMTGGSESLFAPEASTASIELYWLALGAGGWFVRLNGRIYEAVKALLERRRPLDLYHTALEVHLPEGRFVSRTLGRSLMPTVQRAASSWKARSAAAGSGASGYFAMRCAAGGTG